MQFYQLSSIGGCDQNSVYFVSRLLLDRDVAAILLENEKWKEMLSVADEEGTTAMRALIASMPGKLKLLNHKQGLP